MNATTYFPEVHIVLDVDEAPREIADMERMPREIIQLDLNAPHACLATTLFEIVNTRSPEPFAVLVIIQGLLRARNSPDAKVKSMGELFCTAPHEIHRKGFSGRLRDVVMSLVRQPIAYQRNTILLESIAERFRKQSQIDSAIAKDRWRRV